MKKILFFVLLATALGGLSGCASQQIAQSTDPLCLPNTLSDQTMDAAMTVLEKMHFNIEKFDVDVLYIRTRPLSGAQFFEFWRRDNASAFSRTQANLHSIRRVVELEILPENTTTCMQCRVNVSRLSIPEQPIQGYLLLGGAHTKSHTRHQTLEVDSERKAMSEWIDAGPDHDLEQKILKLIQQEIQKGK